MTTLVSLFLFMSLSWAQDIPLATKFAQQNQHSAFFFVGENSLVSTCSLYIRDLDCVFTFESSSGKKEALRIPYQDLQHVREPLIEGLRTLYQAWQNEGFLSDIIGRVLLMRQGDVEGLAQIIYELEQEPLQERVLQLSSDSRPMPAYVYSSSRAFAVFSVFKEVFAEAIEK